MKKNIVFISWHRDKQGIGKQISKCFYVYLSEIFGKEISVFSNICDVTNNWHQVIDDALNNSKYGIFLLTPQALNSAWMYYELGVLGRRPEYIYCFGFENIKLSGTPFARWQLLHFSENNLKDVLMHIVQRELSDGAIGWEETSLMYEKIPLVVPKLFRDVLDIENFGAARKHDDNDYSLPLGTGFFEVNGIMWADRNIGANTETDYGDFYAWGETSFKDDYSQASYKYHEHPNLLPSLQDVATNKMGEGWRLPTREEFDDLLGSCKSKWITYGNVCGVEFTNTEGKKLFLPASGYRNGRSNKKVGVFGVYLSSSLHSVDKICTLQFTADSITIVFDVRYVGCSVRAVRRKYRNKCK